MFESDVFLLVLESSFYHILQSLPDHNWQEHDDYDLEAHDAGREVILDVFKGSFYNRWQNQSKIHVMTGPCTRDVKGHITLLNIGSISFCMYSHHVCLPVLFGSCVKVRSLVTIRCHTLHWCIYCVFFRTWQPLYVLAETFSQQLFAFKNALVVSNMTFGGWFQICSCMSCPCWGLGKKSNDFRCFFL